MNSTELLDLMRLEIADTAVPQLWSDAEIYGYLDDAQKMFCRNTEGISDGSTAAVVEVAVAPATDWVSLHPSILTVRTVARGDNGREVDLLSPEDMAKRGLLFDGLPGQIRRLVLGIEENKARVHPVSSETVTLKLMVYRLPLVDITEDGDQEFEISSQHHRHLLLWAKSLAYAKNDADTYDKNKSERYSSAFDTYCAKVKQEQSRKRHKPRAVAYGGI
jgi:hypothetical protein